MATLVTSPRIGGLEPGWTAVFQATPLIIGESPASTGVVSFNAQRITDTEFVVSDSNKITRDGLGQITGVVDSVGMTRLRTSITQGTILTHLNTDTRPGVRLGGQKTLSAHYAEAIAAADIGLSMVWKSPVNPTKIYPFWVGNIWKNLNDMGAASGHEMVAEDDTIAVYQIGQRVLTFPEFSADATPEVTISAVVSAAQINVTNLNAKYVTNGELYNAFIDDNAMYQVGVRDTVVYSVVTKSYPLTLNQPSPVTRVWPNKTLTPGTYAVSASDGRSVPADIWTAFKGRVTVAVGSAPNMLDVTIKGPDWLIPSYEPPYRLTISDTDSEEATFSVRGTGVVTNPEVIPMVTGADPTLITGLGAVGIESNFIESKATAYDRAGWALSQHAGPVVEFRATIPIDVAATFSYCVGARFLYQDQMYRITDATISNSNISITAVRHTTTGEQTAVWAGKTAGQQAAFWSGHPVEDMIIAPLRS